MKKTYIGMFLGVLLFAVIVPVTMAQTASTTSSAVQALLDQIKALQAQIEVLRSAQQKVNEAAQTVGGTLRLMKELRQDMTGDDVKALQALLAADPIIYPEGVISGYYGPLTAKAVKRFQQKHGFEQVGKVGPKTLKKLNELLDLNPISFESASSTDSNDDDEDNDSDNDNNGRKNEKRLCAMVPPGHLIAPGWLKKQNGERPLVPPCQNLPKGIKDKLDGNWNNGTTTLDKIAPVISAISSSSTTATGTIVSWTTNELATSKLYYGTTTPISLASATVVNNSTLVLSHSLPVSSLTASSTYYYVVESTDGANNIATSSQASFSTL
jgi:peptidoglycan hydrolase-like protein with peptidoglycan-binding domain